MNFKEQALALYKKVFNEDSDAFAKVFTDKYFDDCCRYILRDGKMLSMLYLIGCNVKCDGESYPAAYLYAAATDPEFRGQGLMGQLIKEAKEECEKEGKVLITKPATPDLFGYYGRFGFEVCSYLYLSDLDIDKTFRVSIKEYICFREKLLENTPHIDLNDMEFALSGFELYANDSFCAVYDGEEQKIKEYILKEEDKLSGDTAFAMWVSKNKPCERLYFGIAMD